MFKIASCFAVLCAMAGAALAADTGVFVPTRPGVVVPVLYQAPAEVRATVLLLPGGDGSIGVSGEGLGASPERGGNFLIRSRSAFVAAGLATLAVDAPSDHRSGIDENFRTGPDHAADIAALVAWARQRSPAPVWLVGTSMGSISAAAAAIHLGPQIDGIVLSSSVSRSGGNAPRGGVSGLGLDRIVVATLVMTHASDACRLVGPADEIGRQLTGTPRLSVIRIEGGAWNSTANVCGPWAAHGYNGSEDKAVSAIVGFILAK